jgi:hypothetical protein
LDDLTLGELQDLRKRMEPENLRECSNAFRLVVAYCPALILMAEKYLKLSALDRIKGGYSVTLEDGTWSISGPLGFSVSIGSGEDSRDVCKKVVNRLNGLL